MLLHVVPCKQTNIIFIMDTDPRPRPLGNESTDPFSPTYPPGTLHEILRQEEDPGGEPTPAMDEEAVKDDPRPATDDRQRKEGAPNSEAGK